MKAMLRRVWGFRSGTPWKMILATIYYGACLGFLVIGMTTPPPVPCGRWDAVVLKISTFVLFVWMLSPGIFLSDTILREILPFFKDRMALRSLVGMMIVFVLFQYFFMASESMHTQAYQEIFSVYLTEAYGAFVEAGTP